MSTDYSKISDYDINKLVAEKSKMEIPSGIFGIDWYTEGSEPDEEDPQVYVTCGSEWYSKKFAKVFDPCNEASDAWPIITEWEISIIKDHDYPEWTACAGMDLYGQTAVNYSCGDESESVTDTNPLRAAMIIFLMTKDGEIV